MLEGDDVVHVARLDQVGFVEVEVGVLGEGVVDWGLFEEFVDLLGSVGLGDVLGGVPDVLASGGQEGAPSSGHLGLGAAYFFGFVSFLESEVVAQLGQAFLVLLHFPFQP